MDRSAQLATELLLDQGRAVRAAGGQLVGLPAHAGLRARANRRREVSRQRLVVRRRELHCVDHLTVAVGRERHFQRVLAVRGQRGRQGIPDRQAGRLTRVRVRRRRHREAAHAHAVELNRHRLRHVHREEARVLHRRRHHRGRARHRGVARRNKRTAVRHLTTIRRRELHVDRVPASRRVDVRRLAVSHVHQIAIPRHRRRADHAAIDLEGDGLGLIHELLQGFRDPRADRNARARHTGHQRRNTDRDVVHRPPPVVRRFHHAERELQLRRTREVVQRDDHRLVAIRDLVRVRAVLLGLVFLEERIVGTVVQRPRGFPAHDLVGRAGVVRHQHQTGLVVDRRSILRRREARAAVVASLGPPARIKRQHQRVRRVARERDLRRRQERVEQALRVRRVIPFVRIRDHHRALAEGEIRPALVARRADPPVLVGEAPARPLDHTIRRSPESRHSGVIRRPASRSRLGPDIESGNAFFTVRPEGQPLEVLEKRLLGLRPRGGAQEGGDDRTAHQSAARSRQVH